MECEECGGEVVWVDSVSDQCIDCGTPVLKPKE